MRYWICWLFGAATVFVAGFVWKNPLRFYPAGLIRINPPGKSQKNPLEGGFF